jgi:hypothetical protein
LSFYLSIEIVLKRLKGEKSFGHPHHLRNFMDKQLPQVKLAASLLNKVWLGGEKIFLPLTND